MAYIVFVNPAILSDAGIPYQAAMAATCVAAAFGSLLMGLWARHPIALAPGMGINAYLAYSALSAAWELIGARPLARFSFPA